MANQGQSELVTQGALGHLGRTKPHGEWSLGDVLHAVRVAGGSDVQSQVRMVAEKALSAGKLTSLSLLPTKEK